MKKTLYRVDDYHKNVGDLVGFFDTIEDSEGNTVYTNKTDHIPETGNFSQITEFDVDADLIKNLNLENTQQILDKEIWSNGVVIDEYYYC